MMRLKQKVVIPIVILLLVCMTAPLLVWMRSGAHLILSREVERLQKENKFLLGEFKQFSTKISQEMNPSNNQEKLYKVDTLRLNKVSNSCDTIHIAMVVVGYSTVRNLVTMVKSILFYRHNPLHFHFVSDEDGKYVIQTLFKTWKLPAVNTSFYLAAKARELVAWIPNSHYSGVFGLMKLTLPTILPTHLQKVIVLDTDLMLTSDILPLWEYFKVLLSQGKLLGLVENQSNWYLGNLWDRHKPWPALGRGFNTGVMLFYLKGMRAHNWNRLWNTIATRTLMEYDSTVLADQDVINTLILNEQHLHYVLPCFWNAQLSEHSLSDYCFNNANEFKIVHWNSPLKQKVRNRYCQYFNSVYQLIQNQDGYQFREVLLNCNLTPRQLESPTSSSDPCIEFKNANKTVYRIHPFVTGYDYKAVGNDVTLVTQMSMDRLYMLEPLLARWNGPMSIAVYASDSQVQDLLDCISRLPTERSKHVALHITFKTKSFYPVNHLRNVALTNVNTLYVFLSDIDFIPMDGAYEYLLEAIKVLGNNKRLFVVPAFETHLYRFTPPSTKNKLLKMIDNGTVTTFRSHEWKKGHAPTNYDHWKKAVKTYKIKWAPDFEPYIVAKANITRFDERFAGFGWNKVSHIMELNAQGYQFVVLPSIFIIHMPHSPSPDINHFRRSKLYRDCVQVIKTEFKEYIDQQYLLVN